MLQNNTQAIVLHEREYYTGAKYNLTFFGGSVGIISNVIRRFFGSFSADPANCAVFGRPVAVGMRIRHESNLLIQWSQTQFLEGHSSAEFSCS